MIRSLPRGGLISGLRFLRSSHSLSFTPTGSLGHFELERSPEEINDAIPNPPDLSLTKRLYEDIVRPSDVCDLLIRPAFEDVAVTSLALGCPLSGKDGYQVVSKSSVGGSKLLFANLASSWLNKLNLDIFELSELPQSDSTLTYTHSSKNKLIANQFSDDVLQQYDSLENFYTFFIDTPNSNITIETITQFLLTKASVDGYTMIIQYLTKNAHLLNPFVMNDFVAILLDDLFASASVEKVEIFDTFLNTTLVVSVPQLLEDLPPVTLDRLAYITAASSDLSTSNKALTLLCRNYRVAPAQKTFELYMARYTKLATQQQFTKNQILRDISSLKSIVFHYGMTTSLLKLVLSNVVDNTYDLSHLVKLVKDTTPQLLGEHGLEIMHKLREIQKATEVSELVASVQATNLGHQIVEYGGASPKVKLELMEMLTGKNGAGN